MLFSYPCHVHYSFSARCALVKMLSRTSNERAQHVNTSLVIRKMMIRLALKGQKRLARGNALGIMKRRIAPCRGKSFAPSEGLSPNAFAPLGRMGAFVLPRALPWAMCLLGLQPAPCTLVNHRMMMR